MLLLNIITISKKGDLMKGQKINNVLKSKVFKNGFWLTVLQLVNTVIPILTIPYITRILGAEEYGVFSIALNWVTYLQVLVEYGFGLSGARKVSLDEKDKDLNRTFNNIISARLLLCIVSIIILNFIAFISKFELKTYISILLLSTMILGTTFQLTWLFQGKQDMKFITIANVTARIISVLLIFILVKTNENLYLYCFFYSITWMISSAISLYIAKKKYRLKFRISSIKDILHELNDGKYLFASAALIKIFSGFGVTVLGIIASSATTGVYAAISKIPFILTMFFVPISQAIYPHNSAKFKNNFSDGVKNVKKICIPICLIFLVISIVIALFKDIIVYIMFGSSYAEYSIIIIPLVLQFILAMINNFLGVQILVASGNQKRYSFSLIIGGISIILSNIILGHLYGIYGIAFAAVVGETILSSSLYYNIRKIYSLEKDLTTTNEK